MEAIEVIKDQLDAIETELEDVHKKDKRIQELEQAIRVIHSVDSTIVDPPTMMEQLRAWARDLRECRRRQSIGRLREQDPQFLSIVSGLENVADDIERQIEEQDDGSSDNASSA